MGYIDHESIIFTNNLPGLIRAGWTEIAKVMISNLNLYHSVDNSNATLLHVSVECHNQDLVQHLLDQGCDVNAQDSMGNTPLMLAVQIDHWGITKALLSAGADVEIRNNLNKSALHMVFSKQELLVGVPLLLIVALSKKCRSSEELAKKLIDAGCHLYQATFFTDPKIIKYMIDQGLTLKSLPQEFQQTILHVAVALDHLETVKLLLKHSADIGAPNIAGGFPLLFVYRRFLEHNREKMEILKILLPLVTPTLCAEIGVFQVGPTLIEGNREAVSIVLQSNFDFTAKDECHERRPLHYLAMNCNPGIVEELKIHRRSYEVNAVDKWGISALHCAAKHGNVAVLEYLLEQGADPNLTHRVSGATPLYHAFMGLRPGLQYNYDRCMELLLQHNVDPQIVAKKHNRQFTIFNAASQANNGIDRLKPVVAHLAMLQRLGTPISEVIASEIESNRSLKKHFDRCRKILEKKITGSVTVFKCLTSDEKKIAQYLNNENFVRTLRRCSYNCNLRSSYSYYFNTMKRRILKVDYSTKLKNKAAQVICEIMENCFDQTNIAVEKIISYLDDQSRRNLCQL